MSRTRQEEVDRNFEFFRQKLPELLKHHRGRYVVIRDQEVRAVYDTAADADIAGSLLFPDGPFSIQKVRQVMLRTGRRWQSATVPDDKTRNQQSIAFASVLRQFI